jgi:hypothetical protein
MTPEEAIRQFRAAHGHLRRPVPDLAAALARAERLSGLWVRSPFASDSPFAALAFSGTAAPSQPEPAQRLGAWHPTAPDPLRRERARRPAGKPQATATSDRRTGTARDVVSTSRDPLRREGGARAIGDLIGGAGTAGGAPRTVRAPGGSFEHTGTADDGRAELGGGTRAASEARGAGEDPGAPNDRRAASEARGAGEDAGAPNDRRSAGSAPAADDPMGLARDARRARAVRTLAGTTTDPFASGDVRGADGARAVPEPGRGHHDPGAARAADQPGGASTSASSQGSGGADADRDSGGAGAGHPLGPGGGERDVHGARGPFGRGRTGSARDFSSGASARGAAGAARDALRGASEGASSSAARDLSSGASERAGAGAPSGDLSVPDGARRADMRSAGSGHDRGDVSSPAAVRGRANASLRPPGRDPLRGQRRVADGPFPAGSRDDAYLESAPGSHGADANGSAEATRQLLDEPATAKEPEDPARRLLGGASLDPAELAALVNEALVEQARLHGVDIA